MNKVLKALGLSLFAILLFVAVAYLIQNYLLHLLPITWQSDIVWLVSAFAITITVFSGLSQIIGIGVIDLFKSNDTPNEVFRNNPVILKAIGKGEVKWEGDIFQEGSTKVVLNTKSSSSKMMLDENIERLIKDIQKNLHSEDSKLPYVLTLCNDLCNLTGLIEKYGKWLNLELTDYVYFEKFRDEFGDADTFNTWWDNWALYRMIDTYMKMESRSEENGQIVIDILPYRSFLIGFSIPEIVEKIQVARQRNTNELSVPLINLSLEYFSELQEFLSKGPVQLEMSRDIEVFFKVSDIKNVFVGIRKNIISLLSDVRNK